MTNAPSQPPTTPGANGHRTPAPVRFSGMFYGWVMLGLSIAMAIATMPGQTVLVALWKEPMREDLGLSLASVSLAYTIGTILAGLPIPFVGRFADRCGLRITVACVSLAFCASLVLMREVNSIYAVGVGFFFVRFLGQGSLSMLSGHTIAMWFERRLGITHSMLAILGFAAGSAILPLPTAWLLKEIGWQNTLLMLAAMVFALTIPGVVFLFRNKPEDIGQRLDGDPVEHEPHDVLHGGPAPKGDPAFTVRQALGTRAYWILTTQMMASGFVGTALLFHMPDMLRQAGLTDDVKAESAVANMTYPIGFGAAILIVGWLADRYHPAKLLPSSLVLMAVSVLVCLGAMHGMVGEAWIVPAMATGMAIFGASQSVIMGVANPTIARYFGRTHHGAIRGTITTAMVIGTGGGPYAAALGFELGASDFSGFYLLCVASTIPLGIGAALLRAPTPPRERDLTPGFDEPDPTGPTQ